MDIFWNYTLPTGVMCYILCQGMSTYMYMHFCCRLSMKGTNLRTEPKHIVFLSQLLLLFKFCHVCKADNPMIEAGGIGTQAAIKSTCGNPACRKEQTWYSQPLIP